MTEQEAFTTILGLGLVFLMMFLVIILAAFIVMIISAWKIFTKAGEEGWKSIIPFYSVYVLCSIIKIPNLFWGWLASYLVMLFGGDVFYALGSIGTIVISIITSIKLAQCFGKSGGFAVGLILLPVVFYPILAFGSATYQPEVEQTNM